MLTIKGEKKEEKEKKKKDYYLSERRYGSFQRSFRVPNGINPDKIEPNFKNGVLTITLLKTPEAHHRQGRLKLLPIGMSVCRIRKRAARWSPRTQGRPEGRSSVGPRAAASGSTFDGRYQATRNRCNDSRRNSS